MTTDEIRAELRRSACEDERPFMELHAAAFGLICEWSEEGNVFCDDEQVRLFYLLVAEAL